MTTKLIPTGWKNTIEDVRESVVDRFQHWTRPKNTTAVVTRNGTLPSALTGTGPAIEVSVKGDELVVTAELPGLNENDFRVELEGERLILFGEKKAEREEKGREYYYRECSYGSFWRAIPLLASALPSSQV